MRSRLLAVVAALPLIVAAGCGGDDDGPQTVVVTAPAPTQTQSGPTSPTNPNVTTPTTPTTTGSEPSAEGRVSGTGYSFSLPDGFEDQTGQTATGAIRVDRLLIGPTEERFRTNINVVRVPNPRPGTSAPDLADQFTSELRSVGVRALRRLDDTTVDGEPALVNGYRPRAPGGRDVQGRQAGVVHNGNVYSITLTAARGEPFFDAVPAFEEVLSSWQWND
jgi:hypothetical protein